ncbi:16S rRNA (uracil(1498)-N(3))-methyltransferase [Kiritimatiella glycovorans]|uniref:Ribosomal RNA small subunit methyltransferase E n=1 Tax=Kiritimatiella glycovorans TaxID=1307763 RepID=A0A0G3EAR2_9BACT|nr:RsmE family RNA methyltransferase [Kiritimatiella glycovorans]AKJ63343.1 Ribosomal RNA small subunit methyltransferase E [Kiritimatiella glycovorans]
MNLILIEPGEIDPEGRAQLKDARAVHIRKVLGARAGQRLRIGLIDGPRGIGTVERAEESGVVLSCSVEIARPPRPPVDLLLALPRPKILKRLLAQLAAVGVGRIMLTNAEKVERYYFDSHVLDAAFIRARLVEGLQQAGDTRVPDVFIRRELKPFLEDELDALEPESVRLLAHPRAGRPPEDALRAADPRGERRVLAALGPEGGWTDYELDMIGQHSFIPVTMGPRTLRSDTAAIALHARIRGRMREA